MNIVLSGGGTAGHVNPAIAIAEELKERYPNGKVAFIGRHSGSENELIRKAGIPLFTVKTYGLSRKLSIENIKRIKLLHIDRKLFDYSRDFVSICSQKQRGGI